MAKSMSGDADIADFGTFTGPVLLCGGTVSNLEALEGLERQARRHGIAPDHIIHTGDVIAYCADAAAAAAFVAERGWRAIKGNVEAQLAAASDSCACGFAPGSVCDALTSSWYAHADSQMTPALRRWMAELPAQAEFRLGDRRFRVVHGSVATTNRFMFASLPEAEFAGELGRTTVDCVIAGHTGLPFTRALGDRLWHNPGSLGLPANDGTPRGWYSLIEPAGDGVRLPHLSFRYDHDTAAAKMRLAGLPEGYAACLENGLWPSLDVLPKAERAATGQALVAHVRDWPPARSRPQASAPAIQPAPMIGPVPSA
jgi:predicted phosphodiesterase